LAACRSTIVTVIVRNRECWLELLAPRA